MKTKFNGILTLLLALSVQFVFAQKTVTGNVSDEAGPLPGVNILIKGTTTGTDTDFDGNYSIMAKQGDVLVFSYVGMETVEKVIGASNVYNVTLTGANVIGEVVITSVMGIQKKEKSITAGSDIVDDKELIQSAPVTVTSALVGKVSGLDIYTANNGVDPTSRIVLRGNRSLTGNNEALIVIDGVIAPKSAFDALNPNDVASLNILKGAGATALYGPDANNGAIIITTKSGKNARGGFDVNFNSSLGFENAKFLPKTQSSYGSGWNGEYDNIENTNWGPRLDGQLRPIGYPLMVDGVVTDQYQMNEYSAKDNLKNFFETGLNAKNHISFSTGDEKTTFYMSASDTRVSGIVPSDSYQNNTFRMNVSRKLSDKLTVKVGADYFTDDKDVVDSSTGKQNRPVYWAILNTPISVDVTKYKDWRNDLYSRPDNYFNGYYENPYWLIDNNRNESNKNRFRGNVNVGYQVTPWWNINYTLGTNTYSYGYQNFSSPLSYTRSEFTANDLVSTSNYQQVRSNELQSDLLFNFDFDLSQDINSKVILGNHVEAYKSNSLSAFTQQHFVPGYFNPVFGLGEKVPSQGYSQNRRYAFFGSLELGYKDYLFLTATARNDWFSVLDKDHNSIFYPSVGVSFIPTDAFDMSENSALTYLKLFANYAEVGNANSVGAYANQETFFVPGGFPFGETLGLSLPSTIVSDGLKPERTKSFEVGFNSEFFNNRLGLNLNLYKTNSIDQILYAGISSAAGGSSLLTNVGDVENKGLEFDITAKPFKNRDGFSWDLALGFALNKNKVISLNDTEEGGELSIYGFTSGAAGVYAIEGMAYPQLKASAYERDDQGRVLIDPSTGNPLKAAATKTFGATAPPQIYNLKNVFSYKNLSLAVVADYKTGHVFYSDLASPLEFTGRLANRPREPFVFPNSAYINDAGESVENTSIPVSQAGSYGLYEAFWGEIYGDILENYVVDASSIKLREIALTYRFPRTWMENTPMEELSVGVVARNVFMWVPKANVYTDPEFYSGSSNAIGFGTQREFAPTGTYGFKLNVQF